MLNAPRKDVKLCQEDYLRCQSLAADMVVAALKKDSHSFSFYPTSKDKSKEPIARVPMLDILGRWRRFVEEMRFVDLSNVHKFGVRRPVTANTPCEDFQYKAYFNLFKQRYLAKIQEAYDSSEGRTDELLISPSLTVSKIETIDGKVVNFNAQIYGYIANKKVQLTAYENIGKNSEGLPSDRKVWCHTELNHINIEEFEVYLDMLIQDIRNLDLSKLSEDEAKKLLLSKIAVFHWWYSHVMIFWRGSASIGEVYVRGFFRYHGFEVTWNKHYMPDCIALTCKHPDELIDEYQIDGKCIANLSPVKATTQFGDDFLREDDSQPAPCFFAALSEIAAQCQGKTTRQIASLCPNIGPQLRHDRLFPGEAFERMRRSYQCIYLSKIENMGLFANKTNHEQEQNINKLIEQLEALCERIKAWGHKKSLAHASNLIKLLRNDTMNNVKSYFQDYGSCDALIKDAYLADIFKSEDYLNTLIVFCHQRNLNVLGLVLNGMEIDQDISYGI